MNPLETFRLVVVYLLPALLALLLGTPSSPAGASPSFPSRNDANARRAPPGSAAVFVDGSVTQGKPAGVGVWYGVGHPLNFAAALPSPPWPGSRTTSASHSRKKENGRCRSGRPTTPNTNTASTSTVEHPKMSASLQTKSASTSPTTWITMA